VRTPESFGWAARLLAAAVITLLLCVVALFFETRDLQAQLDRGRRERTTAQHEDKARVCALLQAAAGVPDRARYELCSP